ncbi:MAG TPA: hypothetical protein PLO37_19725 [Candidatus Hydrogenedentes bacterium]|nr:hypothetical protein [Candidatus Hydrogenedentota bacterium]HPG69084.1 hypothetical protein [Candidatus Hydrogenedentota bacterium]
MKTLSFKLAEGLDQRLAATAKKQGMTRSDLVRMAIETFLSTEHQERPGSCLDLAGDLIGRIEAPTDLSSNPRHMKGFGT